MILAFSIQNFKSILNLLLSMQYSEGTPNDYKCYDTHIFFKENKYKISPVLAVYGANASGKSNIIEAMNVFINLIETGLKFNYYKPDKLNKMYDNTKFEIEVVLDKKYYKYTIAYNDLTIVKEQLLCNNETLILCENQELKEIYEKSTVYNKEKLTEIYNVECKNANQQQDSTLLIKLFKGYANFNLDITSFCSYLINNIEILKDDRLNSAYYSLKKLANELNDEQLAMQKIIKLIKKLDIDIENIEYELKQVPFGEYDYQSASNLIGIDSKARTINYSQFYAYHKDIKNQIQRFKIQEESLGTQIILSLIAISLAILEQGGVLFVDELDLSIHPLLLILIVKLFKDKRYNKKNSQLIFTSHCSDLLEDDIIRKSEVGIVTKTKNNGSKLIKLSDFKELRNVINFRKKYLLGEFSGIPHAYI